MSDPDQSSDDEFKSLPYPDPIPNILGGNPRVFFNITIGGSPAGRIVMELYKDVTPIPAKNFRTLCTSEKGLSELNKKPLHYEGTNFYRTRPNSFCQGGDITHFDGTGGECIYGGKFADENFKLKHDVGTISMANDGAPNTNGSQFFLCTVPMTWHEVITVILGRWSKSQRYECGPCYKGIG